MIGVKSCGLGDVINRRFGFHQEDCDVLVMRLSREEDCKKGYLYLLKEYHKDMNGWLFFLEKTKESEAFIFKKKAHPRYFRQVNNK